MINGNSFAGWKHWLFFLTVSVVSLHASAQIVDDTTKLVYGPETSKYTFERHLRDKDSTFFTIDTTLYGIENFEFIKKSSIEYQNLGTNGTALNPIQYVIPRTIGRSSGYQAYEPYLKKPEDFKYYDTKSPFMDLQVAFGALGRSSVDFSFSRNIKPNWNFGFDIQRISTEKQIGAQTITGDQNVASSTLDIYTFYKSPKSNYTLLFHMIRFDHKVKETGGVDLDASEFTNDIFFYRDSDIKLTNAVSQDKRINFHLFHTYTVKPFFEVYHIFDKNNISNSYDDFPLSSTTGFYEDFLIATDSTQDGAAFNEFKNEVGIKGKFSNRLFYNAYLKRRDVDFEYVFLDDVGNVGENYLGGDVKLFLNDKNVVGGNVEFLQGGDYYFQGFYRNDFIKASYTSSIYRPSFLSERFFGNHYEWSNNFESIFANTLEGEISYELPFVELLPKVSITNLNRYIYFDTDKLPKQTAGSSLINNYTLEANFKFIDHIFLDNTIVYTGVTGAASNLIRAPKWYGNSRWFYKGVWFNKFMPVELGVNFRWRSSYFGLDYDPITQQFFLQNETKLGSYIAADLFITFQADKFRLFAKMTYLNQGAENGYLATPLYPGQPRAFDIGLRWLFFD